MKEILNVKIVLSRCRRSGQLYGIRFEEKARNQWEADWAFPIKEKTAKNEGFDRSEITGNFTFAASYPHCPGCEAASVFHCSCGKVACCEAGAKRVKCPWCTRTVTLGGTVDRLSAGGDA